jgi:HSP20 family protein
MAQKDLPAETWPDYDAMVAELQRRFNEIIRGLGIALWEPENLRLLSMTRAPGIAVDVRDHGDEVIVVADLPGIEKQDIHIQLPDPKVLQISIDHREEKEEKEDDYYQNERFLRSRSRTVFLPADVTEEGVSTSYKNGVLELRLKKTSKIRGKEISIT